MNSFKDCWTRNGEVKIHYIEKGEPKPDLISLVVSPGIWEPAERALPLLSSLQRHGASLSFRGRGRSDTPSTGYDIEDHVGDLDAVVGQLKLERLCILAFSRGVPYALGYTLEHLDRVAGLILVDQPPVQNRWQKGEAGYWKNKVYLGKPLIDFIRPDALDRIEEEARRVEFWSQLRRIKCPVLILRGLAANHEIPPDLSGKDSERYLQMFSQVREIGFKKSGHMIPDNEPEKYFQVVRDFLQTLDNHQ